MDNNEIIQNEKQKKIKMKKETKEIVDFLADELMNCTVNELPAKIKLMYEMEKSMLKDNTQTIHITSSLLLAIITQSFKDTDESIIVINKMKELLISIENEHNKK